MRILYKAAVSIYVMCIVASDFRSTELGAEITRSSLGEMLLQEFPVLDKNYHSDCIYEYYNKGS